MRHSWRCSRSFEEHPDGQRRWDHAYQLLLHWSALPKDTGSAPPGTAVSPDPEEVAHASGDLRSRLHPPAGADPDY
jgi:hypothetical protein